MTPISEETLQLVEDVMRGIGVEPHPGWLGQTVQTLCAAVRTLQTERAALAAYTQAQKDQAWDRGQSYRSSMSYGGYRHAEGLREAYGDILLRLTTEPPAPVAPLMTVLAELSQGMPDYD